MKSSERKPGRRKDEGLAARRKAEILAGATRLFAEAGFRQADVQVLADRLGVGKGTIYRYFPTKEALFFGAVDAGMRALVACMDEIIDHEPDAIERLKKAILSYLHFFDQNPDLVELLIIERAEFRDRKKATYFVYSELNYDKHYRLLERAIDEGAIRNMSPERIINVVGDCLYGAIFTNHFSNRTMPFDRQASEIVDIVLHGILRR